MGMNEKCTWSFFHKVNKNKKKTKGDYVLGATSPPWRITTRTLTLSDMASWVKPAIATVWKEPPFTKNMLDSLMLIDFPRVNEWYGKTLLDPTYPPPLRK